MHVYQILVSTVERAEMRMERPHVNARDFGQNRCAKVRHYSQSNADSLIIYLLIHLFTKFFTVRIYNSSYINCKLRPTISKKVNLQQYYEKIKINLHTSVYEGIFKHEILQVTFKVCLYYRTSLQHEKEVTSFRHPEKLFSSVDEFFRWKRRIATQR